MRQATATIPALKTFRPPCSPEIHHTSHCTIGTPPAYSKPVEICARHPTGLRAPILAPKTLETPTEPEEAINEAGMAAAVSEAEGLEIGRAHV